MFPHVHSVLFYLLSIVEAVSCRTQLGLGTSAVKGLTESLVFSKIIAILTET